MSRTTSSGANRAHLEAISALLPAYWVQAHQAGWSALNQEATVSTLPPKIRRRNIVRAADRRRTTAWE